MTIEEIEKSANINIQKIRELQKSIKEDIREAHLKKSEYDREIKEYKKIQTNSMIAMGTGWLILWMELQDRIKRDEMIIRIGKDVYSHDQMADLLKVAIDRYELVKEAKRNGIELSAESKKKLKSDRLSFLIEESSHNLFKKDENNTIFSFFIKKDKEQRDKNRLESKSKQKATTHWEEE